MGLDMYLTAERLIMGVGEVDRIEAISKLFPELGDNKIETVVAEVAYWRKANAVHSWFVETVQGGEDNCQKSYVSLEQLQDLLAQVENVISNPDSAEEVLPTSPGFFFGNTDYDESYIEDMKSTKDQLAKILGNKDMENWNYYYQASW